MITEQNCTMLCDFYQLTMGNGYYNTRHADRIAYFDVFFRKVPDGGGYAVCAGLEQRSEERRVGKECRSRWSPYH